MTFLKYFFLSVLLAVILLMLPLMGFKTNKKVLGLYEDESPYLSATFLPQQDLSSKGRFYAPILAYHHIAKKWPQNSYFVSPDIFDKQLQWLKDNGYNFISMDTFYDAAKGQVQLPKKPVVITFDDGNIDQFINAFPILKKHGATATFFIKTNSLGKGGMSLPMLQELLKYGNIIGSHTINHDNLNRASENKLQYELEASKKILEKNLGIEIKYFAYPGGAYSKKVIEATAQAGYLAAVTTKHKVYQEIKNKESFYTLPRVHIDDEMPTFIDWVQGKNLD